MQVRLGARLACGHAELCSPGHALGWLARPGVHASPSACSCLPASPEGLTASLFLQAMPARCGRTLTTAPTCPVRDGACTMLARWGSPRCTARCPTWSSHWCPNVHHHSSCLASHSPCLTPPPPPALLHPCPPPVPAAAWRIDDYLGGGEGEGDDDDLDLASLRAHRLQFAKDRKDAMSRRWGRYRWRCAAVAVHRWCVRSAEWRRGAGTCKDAMSHRWGRYRLVGRMLSRAGRSCAARHAPSLLPARLMAWIRAHARTCCSHQPPLLPCPAATIPMTISCTTLCWRPAKPSSTSSSKRRRSGRASGRGARRAERARRRSRCGAAAARRCGAALPAAPCARLMCPSGRCVLNVAFD